MGRTRNTLASVLVVMLAVIGAGLPIIKPAYSQTGVTQPTVPRFEAFLDTQPNFVPPTYGVDPSTGKAVIIKAGYEVLYKWVSVRVYGQPFWEYSNSAGQRVFLYYGVRWKSNLDTAWQTFPSEVKYFQDAMDPSDTFGDGYLISIGFEGIDNGGVGMQLLDCNATGIDFQVEALIGYYDSNNVFVGQSSGWSDTQTVGTFSPNPELPPNPAVPEFPWMVILPLLLFSPYRKTKSRNFDLVKSRNFYE